MWVGFISVYVAVIVLLTLKTENKINDADMQPQN